MPIFFVVGVVLVDVFLIELDFARQDPLHLDAMFHERCEAHLILALFFHEQLGLVNVAGVHVQLDSLRLNVFGV